MKIERRVCDLCNQEVSIPGNGVYLIPKPEAKTFWVHFDFQTRGTPTDLCRKCLKRLVGMMPEAFAKQQEQMERKSNG